MCDIVDMSSQKLRKWDILWWIYPFFFVSKIKSFLGNKNTTDSICICDSLKFQFAIENFENISKEKKDNVSVAHDYYTTF